MNYFCRNRGFGLPGVLLVFLVFSIFLCVLIGANSSTLSVMRRNEGAVLARSAAESVLSKAIMELRQNPNYGQNGETLTFNRGRNDGLAYLSFGDGTFGERKVPRSVNNLDNAENVRSADGELIPARTVRLVAQGRFGTQTRTVAIDLHVPPYPYAVATEGTFESGGDLSLTGISPETGEEVPGHLVTNGDTGTALCLGPNTNVSGDLISVGGIVLANSEISVDGEVRPYSKSQNIPRIDIRQYDPRLLESSIGLSEVDTSFLNSPSFQGMVLRDGDLLLSGDVMLDGCLLFVDGDLEMSGTLQGRGALVCTGRVAMSGVQNVVTDNEIAMLVGGDLWVRGSGVNTSKLQGLIYTEGDVDIQNTTIQGALLSQSNGTDTPSVTMRKAAVLHDPALTKFSSSIGFQDLNQQNSVLIALDDEGLFVPGSSSRGSGDDSPYCVSVEIAEDGKYRVSAREEAGIPPRLVTSKIEALIEIGSIALLEMPELVESEFWDLENGSIGAETGKIGSHLTALKSRVLDSGASSIESSLRAYELEIDPMKFLRYGEEMRIRTIRVLETQSLARQ